MTGGNQEPFRKPCPGSDPGTGCRRSATNAGAAHASPGDNGISKYLPTVTVVNPAGGPNIVPYEASLENDTYPCPASTATNPTSWIGPGDYQGTLVAGNAPNGAWVGTLKSYNDPANWTHTDDDNVNFFNCHKRGWKGVACCLQWNGSFGFNNPDGVPTIQCNSGGDNTPPCPDWQNPSIGDLPSNFEPARVAGNTPPFVPAQNKYTDIVIACTYVEFWSSVLPYSVNNYSCNDSRQF